MVKNINTIRSVEADMLPFELQKILCDKKMPLQCQGFNFILSNSDLHIYSFFKNPELSKFCICHILVLAWHYWTIEPSSTFFAGIGLLQRIPLASITCHSYLKYWQSFVLPCLHSWVVHWIQWFHFLSVDWTWAWGWTDKRVSQWRNHRTLTRHCLDCVQWRVNKWRLDWWCLSISQLWVLSTLPAVWLETRSASGTWIDLTLAD